MADETWKLGALTKEDLARLEAERAKLIQDRSNAVLHSKTGAIVLELSGKTREARVFCGYDGRKWLGKIDAGADRYGHTCPTCKRPTGFEVLGSAARSRSALRFLRVS